MMLRTILQECWSAFKLQLHNEEKKGQNHQVHIEGSRPKKTNSGEQW